MTAMIQNFASNVLDDVTMNAPQIGMDAAYGAVVLSGLDMMNYSEMIDGVTSNFIEDDTMRGRLNSALVYASVASLHRAYNKTSY